MRIWHEKLQVRRLYYSMGLLRRGRKNPPNSIMEHTLYVNIFLEAYGNPSTAEALSLELGVALPYMEDELAISDFYVSRGYIADIYWWKRCAGDICFPQKK